MANKLEDLCESKMFRELAMRLFKLQWRERMVAILMYMSIWAVVWLSWPVHVGVWALLAVQTVIVIVVCVSFAVSFALGDAIEDDGKE